MIKVTHIYTGPDGRSHFRDLSVPTTVNALSGRETVEYLPSTGAGLGEAAVAGPARDFHNAPRRQFVAVLTGALLIETGDGTQQRFGPGDIFLADDLTGQGHKTADVASPARLLYVYVPDDFNPEQWLP
jgi:hypothetical protein